VSDVRRPALALILGCLLLVAGASALDGYEYYQTIEYAATDKDVYQQDIVIHRSAGTAYNETSGGLETWHIYVGDHCREDYGDVRFTNSTGELAYYLWPDYDAESARVCVRLEGADAAGAVTVHYGNPTATTTSDPGATYDLWCDFLDAGEVAAVFDVVGTPNTTYADSVATITCNSREFYQSKKTFSRPARVEFMVADAKGESNRYTTATGFGVRNQGGGGYHVLREGNTPPEYALMSCNGGTTAISNVFSYDLTFQKYRIDWASGTSAALLKNDAVIASVSTQIPTGPLPVTFGRFHYTYYYNQMKIDWILVRAYSATPPAAITFSGEQETAAPPVTAFTATPTAGLAPLTVQFTDTSTGSPTSWAWTFGDGGTSSEQNPQHTYTTPGTYSVNLTATNEYGSDTETKTTYITVYGPVTAQFTTNVTGGTAPLTVQFTDLSTGGPTSWAWSFGDGNTSTDQNPVHTYTTAGTHTVTLTASHPYDSDTETKTAYITVAVLQPFPGLTLIPRDLTGNGLYTDINGNNRLDYNDLTVFFQHLAWAKTAQPIACFDFNGNGWLDYNDVITLFTTISGGA
jgi:PKD repeat protein